MPRLKQQLETAARWVAMAAVAPLAVLPNLERWRNGSEHWFAAIGQLLSLVPGRTGSIVRWAYYRWTLEQCGTSITFLFGSTVTHRAARLGNNIVVGAHCSIGTATIADHVLISARVSILSGTRQHQVFDPNANITEQPPVFTRVHIGENTWIGEAATILADIGSRCVVATGSVVFRPVPDGMMAMGNPARTFSRQFSQAGGSGASAPHIVGTPSAAQASALPPANAT